MTSIWASVEDNSSSSNEARNLEVHRTIERRRGLNNLDNRPSGTSGFVFEVSARLEENRGHFRRAATLYRRAARAFEGTVNHDRVAIMRECYELVRNREEQEHTDATTNND